MKGLFKEMLDALSKKVEFEELCSKTADYLKGNCFTDSKIRQKFLDAVAFLLLSNLWQKLDIRFIDEIVGIRIGKKVWLESVTEFKFRIDLDKEIKDSREKVLKDNLRYFAQGICMYKSKLRKISEVSFDFNSTLTAFTFIAWPKGKTVMERISFLKKIHNRYAKIKPDIFSILNKEGYLEEQNKSGDFPSFLRYKPLKPYEEIEKRIIKIINEGKKCPICGRSITTAKIRKDSKVCTKCRKRKADLKKKALEIIKNELDLFKYIRFHRNSEQAEPILISDVPSLLKDLKSKLIKEREKSLNWLRNHGREDEIWEVQDWDTLTKIIYSETLQNKLLKITSKLNHILQKTYIPEGMSKISPLDTSHQ